MSRLEGKVKQGQWELQRKGRWELGRSRAVGGTSPCESAPLLTMVPEHGFSPGGTPF